MSYMVLRLKFEKIMFYWCHDELNNPSSYCF
jgi:hypothetical protein